MAKAEAQGEWLEIAHVRAEREDAELMLLRERLELLNSQRARAALSCHRFALAVEHALASSASAASASALSSDEERAAEVSPQEPRSRTGAQASDPWAQGTVIPTRSRRVSLEGAKRRPNSGAHSVRRSSFESSVNPSPSLGHTIDAPHLTASPHLSRGSRRASLDIDPEAAEYYSSSRASSRKTPGTPKARSGVRQPRDLEAEAEAAGTLRSRTSSRQATDTSNARHGVPQPTGLDHISAKRGPETGVGVHPRRADAEPRTPSGQVPPERLSWSAAVPELTENEEKCSSNAPSTALFTYGGLGLPRNASLADQGPVRHTAGVPKEGSPAPNLLNHRALPQRFAEASREVERQRYAIVEPPRSDSEEAETSEASDAEEFLRQAGSSSRPAMRRASVDLPVGAHWQQPQQGRNSGHPDARDSRVPDCDAGSFPPNTVASKGVARLAGGPRSRE